MKLILLTALGFILGVLIGSIFIHSLQLYKPTIIHDTINKRVDSIITIEKEITKTIEKTKTIYAIKKDSIIHLPDSVQFYLFRANCERYDYLLSNDSAIADYQFSF